MCVLNLRYRLVWFLDILHALKFNNEFLSTTICRIMPVFHALMHNFARICEFLRIASFSQPDFVFIDSLRNSDGTKNGFLYLHSSSIPKCVWIQRHGSCRSGFSLRRHIMPVKQCAGALLSSVFIVIFWNYKYIVTTLNLYSYRNNRIFFCYNV